MPDLTVSLNGRPIPLTISVKSVAGASLAHLINHKGLTWTYWREVAAYPHPWLLLKLPRPWGWWLVFERADLHGLEDWAGKHPGAKLATLYGYALLSAGHGGSILAQPLKDALSWIVPEHLVKAWGG